MHPDKFAIAQRTLGRRQSSRPLSVELTSGGTSEVVHPEALALQGGFAVDIARDQAVTCMRHEGVAGVLNAPASAAAA